jgi:hypothetical protein
MTNDGANNSSHLGEVGTRTRGRAGSVLGEAPRSLVSSGTPTREAQGSTGALGREVGSVPEFGEELGPRLVQHWGQSWQPPERDTGPALGEWH